MSLEWPQLLVSIFTCLMGALGGYLGASRKVVVLETHMADLLKWKESAHKHIVEHNEDILIHDIEIQGLCNKIGVPRARRQAYREDDR